ncbi:MAG: hypothetical protein IPP81_19365 [Chitinophagaceae bacterium]|nr:hypothetical protein [Chitinophagaceae bacterium]
MNKKRSDPKVIHFLSLKAISENSNLIINKLKEGQNIIIDRYIYSSIAYYVTFEKLNNKIPIALGAGMSLPLPNAAFYLDFEKEVEITKRLLKRGYQKNDSTDKFLKNPAFLKNTKDIFNVFVNKKLLHKIIVDKKSPQEIIDEIMLVISTLVQTKDSRYLTIDASMYGL